MNGSQTFKPSEGPHVRPSYFLDINKFSPFLRFMKRSSNLWKGVSPGLNHTMRRESSQMSPLSRIDEKRASSFDGDSPSNKHNRFQTPTMEQKSYYLPKSNLNLNRNARSDPFKLSSSSSKKSNINKFTTSHSYLISNNYSSAHKSSDFIESSVDYEEKNEKVVKSSLKEKFRKINEISHSLKLSDETYFSPFHWSLYNKLVSKTDSGYSTKEKLLGNYCF